MIINNTVQIRRRDVANILLEKGFKMTRVCRDHAIRNASNYVFEYSQELVDAVNGAFERLHIKEDDPSAGREIRRWCYPKSKRRYKKGGYEDVENALDYPAEV